MKQPVLTIGITTREALECVLTENISVLYVPANLYLQMHSTIGRIMADHGFTEYQRCRQGVIFIQTTGSHRYDPDHQYYNLPAIESL